MLAGKCAQFGDDLVESYSFGHLTTLGSAAFEEHFLLCGACQERLHASDQYVMAAKAAGAQMARRRPARAAMAVATMVFGGLSLFLMGQHRPAVRNTSRIRLASLRGGADAALRHAASSGRLILDVDTSRLPAAGDCRLQIVDHSGQPVWEQRVRVTAPTGSVTVEVDQVLAAGRYWVRLYGPELSEDPWREYGFEID
jgi:hypothetical protein